MSKYLLKNAQGQAIAVDGKEVYLTENEYNNVSFMRRQAALLTNNDLGVDQLISTISGISAHISEQQFYTIDGSLSDYVPFETGVGTWAQTINTYRTFDQFSQDFEDGVIDMGTANGKLSSVDASVDLVQHPIKNWAKTISYTLFNMKQAALTGVFDYVSSLEKARKKNWDLGLQKIVFLGTKTGGKGLLNLKGITKDTTTITKPFASMTAAELNAFVGSVATAWYANCAYSAKPNRFVMPLADYAALSQFTNADYPLVTKIGALENAFKAQFGADFKILPVAYANKDQNGLGGSTNIYTLYRSEIETIKMNVPLAYNTLSLSTLNGFTFESVAAGQFGDGLTVLRPQELLYFTCNA